MGTKEMKQALLALCAKERHEISRLEAELERARRDERPGCSWLVTGLVITIGIREKHVAEIEAIINGTSQATSDGPIHET